MKKVLLVLAMCLMALTAKAQFYVGGSMSFIPGTGQAAGTAQFNLAPELGFNFNDNMGVGGVIAFGTGGGTRVSLNPYFRYSFVKFGPVKLFADADLQLVISTANNQTTTTFGIGACPGISIHPTRHIMLAARMGQIGYYGGTFAFNMNTTNLRVSAFYVF